MIIAPSGAFKGDKEMRKDIEQTLKLSQCDNIMKVIADAKLKYCGDVYYCMVGGKKTAIVRDVQK